MTIQKIKDQHRAAGLHFFDTAAMLFFHSHIYEKVYDNLCFVTSEQDEGVVCMDLKRHAAWDGERRFTVRRFNPVTKEIDTVSEFGQFDTVEEASEWAKQYIPQA